MKDANPIFSDYEVSNFIPGHGIYIFITRNLQGDYKYEIIVLVLNGCLIQQHFRVNKCNSISQSKVAS